jgi:hypothetical protein
MKKAVILISITIGCLGKTYSQENKDSLAQTKGNFLFEGYVDLNYFYNNNNPKNGSNLGKTGYERAFDQKTGQFQIGLAQTKITYSNKSSEAVVDLTFGPHADLGNYGNVVGPLGSTSALAIKQAYFNWKATSRFTLTAGQFGTHIGYEVIDAPLNFHYSLNNLFNNGPFYHIGVKAKYDISSKVSFMAGVVNNWDNLYDNNQFKTGIAQLAIAPSDRVKLYLNYIGGDETKTNNFNSFDSTNAFKQMLDFVGTFALTSSFNVGVNVVGGQLGVSDTTNKRIISNWGGAALYLNNKFTEKFSLGLRLDWLDNTAGVQYIGKTDVTSGTLTGLFTVANGHLFIKPEVRYDMYKKIKYEGDESNDVQQFMDSKGFFTKNSQLTAGLAFVYKF